MLERPEGIPRVIARNSFRNLKTSTESHKTFTEKFLEEFNKKLLDQFQKEFLDGNHEEILEGISV